MKKTIVSVVVLMFVSLAAFGLIPSRVAASDLNSADVTIVLDNSGSMAGQDWEDASDAAKEFINKLKDGDRCSIFCFGYASRPQMLKGFVKTDASGKEDLCYAIDSLSPDYSTPLYDTIGDAMDYLIANKESDALGVVVALTDGQDNVNEKFYPSHDYRNYEYVSTINDDRYGLLNAKELTFIIA